MVRLVQYSGAIGPKNVVQLVLCKMSMLRSVQIPAPPSINFVKCNQWDMVQYHTE